MATGSTTCCSNVKRSTRPDYAATKLGGRPLPSPSARSRRPQPGARRQGRHGPPSSTARQCWRCKGGRQRQQACSQDKPPQEAVDRGHCSRGRQSLMAGLYRSHCLRGSLWALQPPEAPHGSPTRAQARTGASNRPPTPLTENSSTFGCIIAVTKPQQSWMKQTPWQQ